mmetsp:Transcript_70740/g.219417  ORF Transcript_70740/g.219417 Transcript_70740/m.219417 type:complete len:1299 (-) Transcript_70740:92-3988(-)
MAEPSAEEAPPEWHPHFLEGRLVKISGVQEELAPWPEAEDPSPGGAARPLVFDANGQTARVDSWSSEEAKCLVTTLDGVRLKVPAEKLRECEPPGAEEGGFDLMWPRDEGAQEMFAPTLVDILADKGYCVIQMWMGPRERERAIDETYDMTNWMLPKKEFEPAYLGRQFKCKTAWLEDLAEAKDQVLSALDRCDLHFSDFTKFMLPLAPCALGFVPYSRTNAMVRMPYQSNAEESKYQAEEVQEEDIEDGLVDSHINFVKRRTLCALFVIETGGGELTLISKDENKENVVLEVAKGHLIVFPHNTMSYIYNPFDSNDLVMQSWILQEPDQLTFVGLAGDQASKDEALGVHVGPNTPDGFRTNVFGFGVCFPGGSHGCLDAYWSGTSTGVDGQVGVPFHRFDMEIYSRAADEWFPGTSYAVHGGFMCEDIYAIDNELFGISEEEAYIMAPAHRMLLEKGYECLYRSGYRQGPGLQGRKIGVFVGHSGDDWSYTQTFTCGYEDKFKLAHSARVWGTLAGRIAYILGLKGPQALCDTACSSALVAYGVGHSMLRDTEPDQNSSGVDNKLNEAVMAGANLMPGPGNYINLCGPHMLSVMGRCFTFDHSADGFARGEGVGAFYVKNEAIMSTDAYATVIGACLNQDGRSASMTAPNGPSQQECIRGSMREAGLSANQVTCAECHGTGTALGDPIEIGALQNVLSKRERAILKTSAKSNMAHLEASAGMAGFAKCIMMILGSATPPNLHLKILNPHLIVEGYPVHFTSELTPWGQNSGYCGVSSFGIGGTNARGEIVGRCQRGPEDTGRTLNDLRNDRVDFVTLTCPRCEGKMLFPCGTAVPQPLMQLPQPSALALEDGAPGPLAGRYRSTLIRDEFADYSLCTDCYQDLTQGEFRCGSELQGVRNPNRTLYIRGTWDGFSSLEEMSEETTGSYTFAAVLGETRCERFQIVMERSRNHVIYPAKDEGGQTVRIHGPDDQGQDKYWAIDARESDVAAGTVYQILFMWEGDRKRISWTPMLEDIPAQVAGQGHRHRYDIVGSWAAFKPMEMTPRKGDGSLYETVFRIGPYGAEEFSFVRDGDAAQVLYPALLTLAAAPIYPDRQTLRAAKGRQVPYTPQRFSGQQTPWHVPVRGPDRFNKDKRFRVKGKEGEAVSVQLRIVDAHASVTVTSRSFGTRSWESADGLARKTYYVTGTFNDWALSPMAPDDSEPGIYVLQLQLEDYSTEFQLVIDADPLQKLYPQIPGAASGEGFLEGPNAGPPNNDDRFWLLQGQPFTSFDIRFDPKTSDKRRAVTWKAAAAQQLGYE